MKKFDSRVYSISDLVEWDSNDLLQLSPDFQRRSVWSEKAKSFLVDTIIRGKPIPKMLLTQKLTGKRNIRVVVDGQQRLRSILGFLNGDFKISRAHNKEYAGLTYEQLPSEVKIDILQYEIGVDLLFNMSYEEMLDVFARINSYTVTLNKQERLNAHYLGYFKQTAFTLGLRYVQYFTDAGIITKAKVSRMGEAELASDLLVAIVDGIQTNKNVEAIYKLYEDEPGDLEKASKRFDDVMSYIGALYPANELANTNWSRIHLFYTLFTVVAHAKFGLSELDKNLRLSMNAKTVGKHRVNLDEISVKYDELSKNLQNKHSSARLKKFIDYSRRRTTDTGARVARTEIICHELMNS